LSDAAYQIAFHRAAAKELADLPGNLQPKIARVIDGLRVDPFPQAAQTLRGSTNARRIRVSQYCVVYEVYVDRVIVYIIADGRRPEIYEIVGGRMK
jgi:mRNA-degrading endonuclease RelE of RelBE toxin-antitoxin system